MHISRHFGVILEKMLLQYLMTPFNHLVARLLVSLTQPCRKVTAWPCRHFLHMEIIKTSHLAQAYFRYCTILRSLAPREERSSTNLGKGHDSKNSRTCKVPWAWGSHWFAIPLKGPFCNTLPIKYILQKVTLPVHSMYWRWQYLALDGWTHVLYCRAARSHAFLILRFAQHTAAQILAKTPCPGTISSPKCL